MKSMTKNNVSDIIYPRRQLLKHFGADVILQTKLHFVDLISARLK